MKTIAAALGILIACSGSTFAEAKSKGWFGSFFNKPAGSASSARMSSRSARSAKAMKSGRSTKKLARLSREARVRPSSRHERSRSHYWYTRRRWPNELKDHLAFGEQPGGAFDPRLHP